MLSKNPLSQTVLLISLATCTSCVPFLLPFEFQKVDTGDPPPYGWYDCYGQCHICIDYDWDNQTCEEWSWVSANPDDDPKQVCYSEESATDAEGLCEAKFNQNIVSAYGTSAYVDECVFTNSSPTQITNICDDDEPYNASYTSGTETLRATLIDIDPTKSEAAITVGQDSDTVPVDGWIEITEAPFRLIQVRLQTTESATLGDDVWKNTMLVNTGPPRIGNLNSGSFTLPMGAWKLDGVSSKSNDHYAISMTPIGVATGTLSSTTFTMSHTYTDGAGSISISLEGEIISRPPIASFSTGQVSGCSVSVDGSASTDPDGNSTISKWHWYVNGYPAGEGSTEIVSLVSGSNVVELLVSDTSGLVSETRAATTVVVAGTCSSSP